MNNSVTGNMDMLDSGYPRGVHDDVGHGCEPGLPATLPCWRLPFVPWYMLFFLSKKAHHQVAWKILQGSTMRPWGCPALLTSDNPAPGCHPPLHHRPCGSLHSTGTNRPRAPTPGTGNAPPTPQRRRQLRLCRRRYASLRAGPPPSRRGAGHESAPTPEGRLVATRVGGAGSVGLISGEGKRTVTPMSARRAAESDRVDDALNR